MIDFDDELKQLAEASRRRRKLKQDLYRFQSEIKQMIDADVSLPLIMEWLKTRDLTTTLPTLRRFIRRVFGEVFYDEFLTRNGWMKARAPRSARQSGHEPVNIKRPKEIKVPLWQQEHVGQPMYNTFTEAVENIEVEMQSKDPRRT